MRHRKTKYLLNRVSSFRRATVISIVKNLLKFQSIKTTDIRAKACRRLVEKLIGLACRNTLDARRRAFRILGEHSLVSLLFDEIGPRFKKRKFGFTRILKIGRRRGDNARMVIFELTEIKEKRKIKSPKAEKTQQEPQEPPLEKPAKEPGPKPESKVSEKPPVVKKPTKKFLGGIRNIFKKERDSL